MDDRAWPAYRGKTVAMTIVMLAQATPPTPSGGWFGFDSLFFLTLVFVFGGAIVTALLTRWSRDKCLKLLNGDRVTIERSDGAVVWGTLDVLSEGVEVRFTTPGVDRLGRRRSSVMIYPAELTGKTLGLLRAHETMTEQGRRERDRQVERSFNPGLFRRVWRKVRIFVNTLRDAFSKAVNLVVGQVVKARPDSQMLATQQGSVTQIGDTLVTRGLAANAYEPLLERHIGKPVIVDLKRPGDAPAMGFAGYLAEYTADFVAVFNVQHELGQTFELDLPRDAGEPVRQDDVAVTAGFADGRITITNVGTEAVLVTSAEREAFEPLDIGATIAPGGTLGLPGKDLGGARVMLAKLRRFDIVAPRSAAIVRHAGELLPRRSFLDDLGLDELPLVPRKQK